MFRNKWILLLSLLIIMFGVFFRILVQNQFNQEGFADSIPEVPSTKFSPEMASYQLLTSVMGPLRRIRSIVLNPSNWKERISMIRMNPQDLARMYLKSQSSNES
jgi:hypothetical protein